MMEQINTILNNIKSYKLITSNLIYISHIIRKYIKLVT